MSLLKQLTGYPRLLLAARPSKLDIGLLITGSVSAIVSGVPFPIIGIFFGQLLDDFNTATCDQKDSSDASKSRSQRDINGKILLIVYLAIAQFVAIYLHLLCWSLTSSRLSQRLREAYLRSLLSQEPAYFDGFLPGEVASRLAGDIQIIRTGTSEKVGICLASLSFFITAYVVAFIKNYRLAAELISLVPAYFLMSLVGSHYIEKYSGAMSDHAATAASIASEALNNMIVVQAFGANARLESIFSTALKASEQQGLKKAAAVGIQSGFLYFIAYSANGLAFWQGSRFITDSVSSQGSGTTTVGATFTVIFILVEASLLISQVAPFIHMFGAAVASYRKLQKDLERTPLIDGCQVKDSRPPDVGGGIEFRNVSFVYPTRPEVTVLDRFNLHIPARKHTAIAGFSGSGKSTIAALLARLYDPREGQILLGREELKDLDVRKLRGAISLVQQDSVLLDRSLLENIAYGLVNSDRAEHAHLHEPLLGPELAELSHQVRQGQDLKKLAKEKGAEVTEIVNLVEAAAVQADADGFINDLQHGYGTIAGSKGALISGGQKQRVALARALVKDPQILILDEATASLDSNSEQRIQKAIRALGKSKTIITIAHRLSTIAHADNIVVMSKGRIQEQGSHEMLLAANGTYADFVRLQSSSTMSELHGVSPQTSHSLTSGKNSESHDVIVIGEKTVGEDAISTSDRELASDEPETPYMSLMHILKGYAPALRPHWLVILAALLAASIVGGAFSAEAVIFGKTVGSLNLCNSTSYIRSQGSFFGLMFLVLALIELFANFVSWSGFGWVSEKVVYTLRVLSFRSLLQQDLQWHQTGRTPAQLLSCITQDGAALAGLSGSVIGTLFSITINLIAAIVLTHVIAWKIALVCLSLVPLLLGCGLMQLRVLAKFEHKHVTAFATSVNIGVEAVSSIKTIVLLSLEESILQTYRRSLKGPSKETFAVTLEASLWQAMIYLLGNLVNALAYWWGSKQIIAGTYSQTQFLIVACSLLVSALLWSTMFSLAPELTKARAAAARTLGLIEIGGNDMTSSVRELVKAAESTESIENAVDTREKAMRIGAATSVRFQDVHFAYPARPEREVLKGLSLEVAPGDFCALVGPSGAGKSTIIALLERLYAPRSGQIIIDGVDVTKHGRFDFRDDIALVPQESVLFEGTVKFNLALGARLQYEATVEDIDEACKLANIHETIMELPNGYETLCGPNGNQFSGGQKQRLAIARALVRKPKLLILDEPTSALDAESERLLQEGLDKAASGITVIAIAHRLHTIMKADVIYLIEAGRCVDRGTHNELLERSATYKENFMHQTVAH